jgi:hypothetical protein
VNVKEEYLFLSHDMYHFVESLEVQNQKNMNYYEMLIDQLLDFHLKLHRFHQLPIEQTKKKLNKTK